MFLYFDFKTASIIDMSIAFLQIKLLQFTVKSRTTRQDFRTNTVLQACVFFCY